MKATDRSSLWLARLFLIMAVLFCSAAMLPALVEWTKSSADYDSSSVLDIKDTYFIIPNSVFFYTLAISSTVIALVYARFTRFTGLRLDRLLGWAHFTGSFAPVVLFCAIPLVFARNSSQGDPLQGQIAAFKTLEVFNSTLVTTFSIAVVAQSLFLINLAFSPFRKRPV